MRRDRGRHADRDALRAVGEQVRERARQHHRLFRKSVIVRAEIDRVLVDALEQQPRDLGHARFGVAIGGGVIAVDIAEIALPVDQRIARGEILREAHQRVVDRLVAMRMEIAHHVADDLGGLLGSGSRIEPQQPHAVKDAAMHRLQPVTRIGQRALHDGRERIGQIALLQRLPQRDLLHVLVLGGNQSRAHTGSVLRNRGVNKRRDAENTHWLAGRRNGTPRFALGARWRHGVFGLPARSAIVRRINGNANCRAESLVTDDLLTGPQFAVSAIKFVLALRRGRAGVLWRQGGRAVPDRSRSGICNR